MPAWVGKFVLLASLWAVPALAQDRTAPSGIVVGRPIQEVIDDFRSQGISIAYSTALLSPDLLVREDPKSSDPINIVNEILAPHGLTVTATDGLYVVTRMTTAEAAQSGEAGDIAVRAAQPEAPIPELSVSASRYEILRDLMDSPTFIDQRTIQQLPILGEDPVRAVQRLPGAAASGVSAQAHLRGSARDDTGMILNGQRLLDPFHVREYHNLFSAIDSRAVNGIEVFTGGFPAQYGDQMGGLVLIDTVTPDKERHTEIGLSVYNTSLLTAGTGADGDVEWLVSARRGNLDLVMNPELGEPTYNDVFAEIGVNFSDKSKVSVNGLVAHDSILLITESDPEEREQAKSDARNAQFWINWRQEWTDRLASYTTLSISELKSTRSGSIGDEEEIVGSVIDRRDISVYGASTHWTFEPNDVHRIKFGGEFRRVQGDFDYFGEVEYFEDFARFPGVPNPIQRSVVTSVDGDAISLYAADRLRFGRRTAAEIGIRWDKQSYTDVLEDDQVSPRLSLVHGIGKATDLRLSWGRYYQSQSVNQLQVEDGVSSYYPAQRADQAIVGLTHRFGNGYAARAEVYRKSMDRVRPRFENMLDPLAVMPELKPDRVRIDPSSAEAHGVELSLSYDGSEALSWWTSYVWSKVEDRIGGRDVARSWDQEHALQSGIMWNRGRWDIAFVLNAHSGWPRTEVFIDPDSDPEDPELNFGPRNARRYEWFGTLDFRVSYKKEFAKSALTLFLEISNATNRVNECCLDFETDEDENENTVLLTKTEDWYPILPAVGILWEF